jgi:hypothetical protein
MTTHWINQSNNTVTINGTIHYKQYGINCFNINGTNHWIQPNGTINIVDPIKQPLNHSQPSHLRLSPPRQKPINQNPNRLRCKRCKLILSVAKNGPLCYGCRTGKRKLY